MKSWKQETKKMIDAINLFDDRKMTDEELYEVLLSTQGEYPQPKGSDEVMHIDVSCELVDRLPANTMDLHMNKVLKEFNDKQMKK